MLKGTALEPDFPVDILAARTEGQSGSDLKETCRNAAMVPVREYMKKADGDREVLEKSRLDVRNPESHIVTEVLTRLLCYEGFQTAST